MNIEGPEFAESAEETVPERDSRRESRKASRTLRLSLLGAVLLGMTALSLQHQRGGTFKPVGVDALCPFGGIETMWSLITTGGNLTRIAASSVVLLVIVALLAVLFGRVFCGYLCPLGALQEFAGKVRRLLGMKDRREVPASIDKYARVLKYMVLAFFTAWTWSAGTLVIRPYDPWVAWTHFSSAELLTEFSVGLGVLVVSLVGSVFYDRFFCKYACPMGAVLALMKPLSVFRIRRDADACIDCGACDKACSMNIAVSGMPEVATAECISCHECVNACPVSGALTITARSASASPGLSPTTVAAAVVALTAGLIVVTGVAGAFSWTMPTAGEALVKPTGGIDAEQVKGSMTFAEISAATGIPEAAFQERFGVGPGEMNAKIKDLAPTYGFDVHTDVRKFVAEQTSGASVAPASTGVPSYGGEPAGD